MYLVRDNQTLSTINIKDNQAWYIQNLRKTANIVHISQIKAGGYYLYKEKFGLVALVKVLKISTHDNWVDFRFIVKQVLYSCWHVPEKTILETGYCTENTNYPGSWHLEPGLCLIKAGIDTGSFTGNEIDLESVL